MEVSETASGFLHALGAIDGVVESLRSPPAALSWARRRPSTRPLHPLDRLLIDGHHLAARRLQREAFGAARCRFRQA
jgi:hypothetical protein